MTRSLSFVNRPKKGQKLHKARKNRGREVVGNTLGSAGGSQGWNIFCQKDSGQPKGVRPRRVFWYLNFVRLVLLNWRCGRKRVSEDDIQRVDKGLRFVEKLAISHQKRRSCSHYLSSWIPSVFGPWTGK